MDNVLVTRVMPNSLSAERSVLGSMMMDKDAVKDVMEILDSSDFYNAPYGDIYEALIELSEETTVAILSYYRKNLRKKICRDSLRIPDILQI